MAGSVNGMGTTWIDGVYDANDNRPRSATEWVICLFLPVCPLRRAVLSVKSHKYEPCAGTLSPSEKTEYLILDEQRLNVFEVLFTYVWRWLVIIPFALVAPITALIGPFATLFFVFPARNPDDLCSLPGWLTVILVIALFIFLARFLFYVCDLLRKFECAVLSIFDNGAEYGVT